ncbi:putative lipid II flippase FtsW [Hazenella sp. IB182357]|uniref:Probable peptidoglycan glycosyltransferase FtsW n=1 Tax=Polycladospora coralii TaxID=2771432 RepID=A0A926N757_9BACL|nr:putative lipid II flippase FtsW [Polycladospora coralii]MBD1371196.1 putative lipid II flippase FtsW [Polycladospora coralii]MBS7530138.1 putative lipid II flippase FtsW [Polycladospora coralii]
MKKKKKWGRPDYWFIFLTFLLLGFGLVMIFSASFFEGYTDPAINDSSYFFKKQLSFALVGIVLFFIVSKIPYQIYQKHVGAILLFCIFSLIMVKLVGFKVNGSTRWIDLGIFSFQPSEYVKLGIIIYTASIMVKKQPIIDQFKRAVIPPIFVIGFICFLLILQPHFSAIVLIFATCSVMMYCAGIKMKHLTWLMLSAIPVLTVVMLSGTYRLARVLTFLDPFSNSSSDGYQIQQALMAVGPGGLTGSGLGESIQKLDYLPEAHTDFIFAIISEELGFIGGLLFILTATAFILRGVFLSIQAPDQFGTLLGIGIISLFAIETIANLGVVTALLPVTGVPLPLISYGGTALILKLVELGILLNISRQRVSAKKNKSKQPTQQPLPIT